MKKNEKSAWRVLTGMLAMAAVMVTMRAGAESIPQVVQVVKVEGNAQYSIDGRTWQTLHTGDVLQPGAVIRTAEKSLVDVTLGEQGASTSGAFSGPNLLRMPAGGGAGAGGGGGGGPVDIEKANIIRIFESTVLGVDKLTVDRTGVDEVSDTQLDLRAGQIMGNVKKLSAQSRYEIKVPNGVAGIRGSWYLCSSASTLVVGDGFGRYAGENSANVLQTWDVPSKHKLDPGLGQVVPIPDAEFDQYLAIFNNMCSSVGGEGGALIGFLNGDASCKNSCSVDTQ
jgi:hypothetical protein